MTVSRRTFLLDAVAAAGLKGVTVHQLLDR
jgi:hypothetical protein